MKLNWIEIGVIMQYVRLELQGTRAKHDDD